MRRRPTPGPLMAAGTTLGIGMGGFLDGIVMHQILQIHSMMSAKHPTRDVPAEQLVVNLQINMFWDGLFHAATWITTLIGLVMLWNAVRRDDTLRSTPTLAGSMILGWGLFNVVEGVIDHHVLHLHHVIESPKHLVWDIGFLLFGAVLILVGAAVTRLGGKRAGEPRY